MLLQAYRWVIDSRDEATGERLDNLEDPVPPLPLPHHPELHQGLPEGPQPGQGHRRAEEADGRAPRLRRARSIAPALEEEPCCDILDHIGFPVTDLSRSQGFYKNALAPLGISSLKEMPFSTTASDGYAGFGRARPQFWIGTGKP